MKRYGILVVLCALLALAALQVPRAHADDPAQPVITGPTDLGTEPHAPTKFAVPQPLSRASPSPNSGSPTFFVIASVFGNPTPGSGYTTATGTQMGRVTRNAIPSSCTSVKSFPGISSGSFSYRYDAYTFVNTADTPVCAEIYVSAAGYSATDILFPAIYLNSFNPANIGQNYLGDAGGGINTFGFSAMVPAQTPFIVVLSEVNQDVLSVYILGVDLQRLLYLPLVTR